MKIDGALILEFKQSGVLYGTGEVYIHDGTKTECIYRGPTALALYDMMKRYIRARHEGSGDWFESDTPQHGKQWRERGTRGVTYEPID